MLAWPHDLTPPARPLDGTVAGGVADSRYQQTRDAEGLTREQFLARAEGAGVDIEDIQVSPGGVTYDGRRGRVELYASLRPPEQATVQATPTGPSILLYSLGAAAAAATAAATVHRHQRAAPPSAGEAGS